ncbi:MAG: nitrous oxide reductase accessory protein NosL [Rhodocyclaceae bacterium]|nr:nitrous oxide reductase accessory protein NosL [Rhodocyclaceae bacterium]
MDRRDLLKLSLAAGTGLAARGAQAQPACATDGTPAQFVPKRAADPKAAENDIEKYPKCPYCGMDRKQYSHSRMLVHYADDVADGTCSLHCAAISLSINIDRQPKAIYVGDNAVAGDVKPLVEVGKAIFLVGSGIKGVMTRRSKVAYGSAEAAEAAQAANGGEPANFDQALLAAYTDMAADVAMIRELRERYRKRAMERQHKR